MEAGISVHMASTGVELSEDALTFLAMTCLGLFTGTYSCGLFSHGSWALRPKRERAWQRLWCCFGPDLGNHLLSCLLHPEGHVQGQLYFYMGDNHTRT